MKVERPAPGFSRIEAFKCLDKILYGHVEGDACLQQVARKIMDSVGRESDIPARYGGEAFVVLMPDTDLDGAKGVACRILSSIKEENIPHRQSSFGHVTMSMGVLKSLPKYRA